MAQAMLPLWEDQPLESRIQGVSLGIFARTVLHCPHIGRKTGDAYVQLELGSQARIPCSAQAVNQAASQAMWTCVLAILAQLVGAQDVAKPAVSFARFALSRQEDLNADRVLLVW
eukprot:TRINITY_DN26335_c1_g2_i1.p3 TRINITY_DN26335_c1_g2~~TRINITY_DN26335_c1_g2_i1.p3  ORF type:complete len:115 (+),score=10.65 TRINITY_DN26335_c1_g2_i1:273-617(+)